MNTLRKYLESSVSSADGAPGTLEEWLSAYRHIRDGGILHSKLYPAQ
jgi:hypothetical protein